MNSFNTASKLFVSVVLLTSFAVAVAPGQPATSQETLTKKELKFLISHTTTSADHERIASYYRAEADRLTRKSLEHEQDLAEYYKNPSRYPSKYPTMADHCRSWASYYRLAAQKASALVDTHEKQASEMRLCR